MRHVEEIAARPHAARHAGPRSRPRLRRRAAHRARAAPAGADDDCRGNAISGGWSRSEHSGVDPGQRPEWQGRAADGALRRRRSRTRGVGRRRWFGGAARGGASVARAEDTARARRHRAVHRWRRSGLARRRGICPRTQWAKDVAVVVNVEARGTTGRSLMFETGPGNLDAARALRSAGNATAGSVFAAVYRILPNDTDLSELAVLNLPALNFAFAEGVERYHTSHDDFAHLNPGSVQHHGDQMLALARIFGNEPLPRPRTGDAVYFDLPLIGLVVYPEWLALPLAVLRDRARWCRRIPRTARRFSRHRHDDRRSGRRWTRPRVRSRVGCSSFNHTCRGTGRAVERRVSVCHGALRRRDRARVLRRCETLGTGSRPRRRRARLSGCSSRSR